MVERKVLVERKMLVERCEDRQIEWRVAERKIVIEWVVVAKRVMVEAEGMVCNGGLFNGAGREI